MGGALIGGTVGATIVAAVQIGEEVFETEISIIPTLDDIVEATANVVDAVTQGVQEVIGAFDEFFSGSVSVPLNFEVLNRDPAFGTDLVMRRAWGPGIGNELALRGAEVEILQTLGIGIVTSHTDEMDGWGLTTVSVAEGTEFRGLCVHLENDAAMISHGITENSFCDFSNSYAFGDFEEPYREARKAAPRTGFVYRVSHRYWNYLAQLTDSYDFARRVIDHEPKQAEVAVGAVANLIGENQDPGPRAFVGCFDYTEMSNTLTATAGAGAVLSSFAGGVATAAGGLGLFAQPFIAKDIFFPSGSSADASRNTATHEYGHFVMCDILADESGALVDLYVQRAIGEGLGENADDETGISIETFADLFASQVNGGVNYIAFSEAETSESNDFCSDSTSYSCLEQNYRNDTSELPVEADAYHAAIRRLVSLAHDALDRPDDDWRTQNVPTNGDHWMLSGGTLPLVPNTMASWNLRDNDDQLAMSGPGLRDWIFRCAGGGIDTDELVGALAEELLEGHSWCRVCPVFAAHDPDVSAMATLQEQWIACRDGLIVDALSSPPNAALRLDAATCSECPAREISDASGACTPCPGDRDVVVGNACVACPSGQVAVGDTCVSCAANEITSGNACQACTALRVADRTTNTCVDCPADAVLDAATFVPEVTCGDAFVDVASLTTPGDLCPDTFWLQVNNVDALGDGEPLQSRLAFGAFGYGPLTSGGDCSGSAAFNLAWTNTDTNGVVSFGTDSLTDDGTLCAPTGVPTCYEPCVYTFPSSGEFAFLSRSELQNEVTSVFRVGIAVDAGSPLVELFANASALCPDPY